MIRNKALADLITKSLSISSDISQFDNHSVVSSNRYAQVAMIMIELELKMVNHVSNDDDECSSKTFDMSYCYPYYVAKLILEASVMHYGKWEDLVIGSNVDGDIAVSSSGMRMVKGISEQVFRKFRLTTNCERLDLERYLVQNIWERTHG